MFEITHFDKRLCHLLRHHLDLIDETECDIYSTWNFSPKSRWKAAKNFMGGRYLCRAQYFPFIYWLVLGISIMGSFYSLNEFTSLFWSSRKELNMWRDRTFYVLPPSVLRKCRLVGALIMLSSWLLLWYAVVKISPAHMTPWLTINMVVLGFELIFWITEVLSGVCQLELNTLLSFSLAIANFIFVNCVQGVFLQAIETNDTENLKLWKTF